MEYLKTKWLLITIIFFGLCTTHTIGNRRRAHNHTKSTKSYENIYQWVADIINSMENDILLYASLTGEIQDITNALNQQKKQFDDIVYLIQEGIDSLYIQNTQLQKMLISVQTEADAQIQELRSIMEQLNQELLAVSQACGTFSDNNQEEAYNLLLLLNKLQQTYDMLVAQRDIFIERVDFVEQDLNSYIYNANEQIRYLAAMVGKSAPVDEYYESIAQQHLTAVDLPYQQATLYKQYINDNSKSIINQIQ